MHSMDSMKHEWTDADFDQMSWHDNAVHGLSIVEGIQGAGELTLDIDYILEWLNCSSGKFQFQVAPATLNFHDVTNLKIYIDYSIATAALTPFTIHQIHVEPLIYENGFISKRWTVEVNWPKGEISFESSGFSQKLSRPALLSKNQSLTKEQRTVENA